MTPDITWVAPILAISSIPLAAVVIRHLRGRGFLPPVAGARILRLEETVALDPKRRLHLVTCDGKRLVILTGGPQDVAVGWVPEA